MPKVLMFQEHKINTVTSILLVRVSDLDSFIFHYWDERVSFINYDEIDH